MGRSAHARARSLGSPSHAAVSRRPVRVRALLLPNYGLLNLSARLELAMQEIDRRTVSSLVGTDVWMILGELPSLILPDVLGRSGSAVLQRVVLCPVSEPPRISGATLCRAEADHSV